MQGIYKIENIKNHKIYIGSSIDIEKRFKEHKRKLKNNNHHSIKLQRCYNNLKDKNTLKYDLVEEVLDNNILKEREQYYINYYDSFNTGYNCSELVDNLKYTTKNKRKNSKKEELEKLYEELKSYLKMNCVKVGTKTLHRIDSQSFKNKSTKEILYSIKWFIQNYDPEKYTIAITHTNISGGDLRLYDKDKNYFASYIYDNGNIFIHPDDIKLFLTCLILDGKYNPEIHYYINPDNLFECCHNWSKTKWWYEEDEDINLKKSIDKYISDKKEFIDQTINEIKTKINNGFYNK